MSAVPAGDYDFANSSLRIFGASQLTLTASGPATLWFACGKGVHIANSSDVVFAGFTQDYTRPCFAQGVLQQLHQPDPETLQDAFADVEFDADNFPLPIGRWFPDRAPPPPPASGPPASQITVKMTFWDQHTLRMIAPGNHLVNVSRNRGGGTVFRITYYGVVPNTTAVSAGSLVTVHPRLGLSHGTGKPGGITYLITNSSGVQTVNFTLHGGATEAIVEAGGEGAHTYRNVRLVRRKGRDPVRLLAANADGFHSTCVRVGPKLIDSELSFTGDDLLNIHSRMSLVLRPVGKTSAYIIDTAGSSSPGSYDESTFLFPEAGAGDSLAFWDLKTLAPAGSATITSAERCLDASVIAEARAAYDAITSPPYSQHIGHDFGTRVWLVKWDEAVAVERFAVVDVPRLRPMGAVIRNTLFHDAYMRFGLFESPGIIVEGNLFERGFPFYIGATGVGWLEGPPMVDNVTVRDNVARDFFERERGIGFSFDKTKAGIRSVGNNTCYTAAGVPVLPCTQLPPDVQV